MSCLVRLPRGEKQAIYAWLWHTGVFALRKLHFYWTGIEIHKDGLIDDETPNGEKNGVGNEFQLKGISKFIIAKHSWETFHPSEKFTADIPKWWVCSTFSMPPAILIPVFSSIYGNVRFDQLFGDTKWRASQLTDSLIACLRIDSSLICTRVVQLTTCIILNTINRFFLYCGIPPLRSGSNVAMDRMRVYFLPLGWLAYADGAFCWRSHTHTFGRAFYESYYNCRVNWFAWSNIDHKADTYMHQFVAVLLYEFICLSMQWKYIRSPY